MLWLAPSTIRRSTMEERTKVYVRLDVQNDSITTAAADLRHDRRYGGKTSWCGAHDRWLAMQSFSAAAAQTAFTEYWQAAKSADERVERLTKALLASIAGWRFEPIVAALQALRGVAAITA